MANALLDLKALTERQIATAPWLRFPATVEGPSPWNKTENTTWRVDATSAHDDFRINFKQTVLDLWSLILGQLPPMVGIKHVAARFPQAKFNGIRAAHACFLGVNRPVGDDNSGERMLCYACKPTHHVVWDLDLVCNAKVRITSPDLVLLIYVKLDQEYERAAENLTGVVTHWSLVECDGKDVYMPRDHAKRFARRLW